MADTQPQPQPEREKPTVEPDGYSGDQDIDTAGTEADGESMTAMGAAARRDGAPHAPDPSYADAPENQRPPVGAHNPGSMHRHEDDAQARARSSDFHDVPDPGSHQQ
jgi:hypothetical protein